MNPLTLILWLSTHWWIFLILAALSLAGAVYSGFVPIAKVIGTFFKACAAVAEFFTEPKEQIAAKVLCCIVFFCIGAMPAFYYGKSVVRAEWEAADKRAEKERKDLDRSIDSQAAKDVEAAEKRVEELERKLNEKATADASKFPDCTFTDSDIERLRH